MFWAALRQILKETGQKEGKGVVALLKEAVTDGLDAVNLSFEDIRKLNQANRVECFVGNFIAENYINQGHLGALLTEVNEAFYGVPSARYEAACSIQFSCNRCRLSQKLEPVTLIWQSWSDLN